MKQEATAPELVKMSTLARRSGVPAATIKHYLREGLLPQPDIRSSKNMALYDVRLVERVKAIKELQRTKFLPLKVIKGVLDGIGPDHDAETADAIQRALDDAIQEKGLEARTRKQLLAAGVLAEELDFLRGLGLLTPEAPDGPVGDRKLPPDHEVYVGDDLKMLRILGEARKAGITPLMLPPAILEPYARAIRNLVRVELELFREGVFPQAGENLKQIAAVATRLSEELVVLLRRKLLLPTLEQLAKEAGKKNSAANDTEAPVKKKSAKKAAR
ncbi:MAG: MerR family transcriptional regulator [Polyangiales bacterium]